MSAPAALLQRRASRPEGWWIVAAAAAAVGAMTVALIAVHGTGEPALHVLLRATARTSLFFFLCAFTASSLALWRPSPVTRWLLVNRRVLGVSFAASHAIHLAVVITLLRVSPRWPPAVILVADGIGYAFVAAMAATSFDRSAAWIGRRAWVALHKTGVYYLWIIFAFTYSGGARKDPLAALSLLLLGGALVLRLALGTRRAVRSG